MIAKINTVKVYAEKETLILVVCHNITHKFEDIFIIFCLVQCKIVKV